MNTEPIRAALAACALVLIMAALAFLLATSGLTLGVAGLSTLACALMIGGLLAAVLVERILLRGVNLAVIYLGIVALETVLVLVFAATLGDALSLKQIAGTGLVVSAMALVAH